MEKEHFLSEQVKKHFQFLFDKGDYSLKEKVFAKSFGHQVAILESPTTAVQFVLDVRDDSVSIYIKRLSLEKDWIYISTIFGFLTDKITDQFIHPGFIPRTLISGQKERSEWQVKRYSEIFYPMWQEIEDAITPHTKTNLSFSKYLNQRKKEAQKIALQYSDTYKLIPAKIPEDRKEFEFIRLVEDVFGFIIEKHPYSIINKTPLYLRLESITQPVIYINIFHTFRKYELGIHLGRKILYSEYDFSLTDISRLLDYQLDPWPLYAKTNQSLQENILILEEHFMNLCKPILDGDTSIIDRLVDQWIREAYAIRDKWIEVNKPQLKNGDPSSI